MKHEPLTDNECEELMYLYRVARNGGATRDEIKRLKELMRRFEIDQAEMRKSKL